MLSYRQLSMVLVVNFLFISCSHENFESLEISDNVFSLTSEKQLTEKSTINKIENLYKTGVDGYFVGEANIKIYYKYFLQADKNREKGAVVISDGRTEAVVKYKEVIYDLFKNGYSVYIHDHRGQGLSDRMISQPDMGFVDEFQNYVKDLKHFYKLFVKPNNHLNRYLLAHSMGGAIGMIYLEQYPTDFKAAAFSSPMLGFPLPTCLVIGFLTDDKPEYAMGNTDYKNGIEPFTVNTLTNSQIRYDRMLEVFEENPKARLGGASYQWVNKSCSSFDFIFNNNDKIKTPIILFSAEEEVIVNPSSHNKFIDLLIANGNNAKGYLVQNAKHELLIEKDEVRISVLTKTLNFFSSVR